ncbi:MAG: helix-turn-helix transcriptional regulator [Pseudomonadota bacterium]
MTRASPLPSGSLPRGLRRPEAAAYVGLGETKFDELVKDGRMPRPKRIDGRVVWDRRALDAAFDALGADLEADFGTAAPENQGAK